MELFRNPEIQKEILYYIVIYLAGAAWAFWQFDSVAAGMVGISRNCGIDPVHLGLMGNVIKGLPICPKKWTVYCMMMGRRCCRIVSEGELAILHTQLNKLVRRIREQADVIKTGQGFSRRQPLADISHQLRDSADLSAAFGEFFAGG